MYTDFSPIADSVFPAHYQYTLTDDSLVSDLNQNSGIYKKIYLLEPVSYTHLTLPTILRV